MNILFAFISLIFSLQGHSINNKQKAKSILLDIMFQDFFKNDTLDLEINNISIVEKMALNSNTAGFTHLHLDISQWNSNTLKISFLDKCKYSSSSKKITLVLHLNGRERRIILDWHKGKFVGLSKKDVNDFYLMQQNVPFVYE